MFPGMIYCILSTDPDFVHDMTCQRSLALDARNRAIGSNIVSVGTLTASIVHPRETFKFAIFAGAVSPTW